MHKSLALALLLLLVNLAEAQSKILDSLNTRLETHTDKDIDRVQTLLRVADRISPTNPDKALKFTSEAESIADEINYQKGKAYSLLYASNAQILKSQFHAGLEYAQKSMAVFESLGNKYGMGDCFQNYARCNFYLGNYDKAIGFYKSAIAMGEQTNDSGRLSASWSALGVLYAKQAEFDKAMEAHQRALQIDEKQKDKFGIASDLINIGTLLRTKGDYAGALAQFFRALELKQQVGDERGIGSVLGSIAMVYSELRQFPQAIEYNTQATEIWKRLNNRTGLASIYQNMGIIYMNQQKNDKAREFFDASLAISEAIKEQFATAVTHMNLGTLDLLAENYTDGLAHFQQAVAIHKKLNNRKELSYAYLKMGKIYGLTKDYDKALEYADKGSAIAKSLGLLDHQRDFSLLRSEVYYDQKNYKLAYENQAQHAKLSDSILAKDVYNNVADVKYSNVYKDKLNSSKTRENNLKDEVDTKDDELQAAEQQKTLWIAGVLCLLVVLGFVVALLKIRKVRMENKQLLTEQKLHRSQMNPHFIFNSIQNVRSLIHDKKEDEAVDYLNQFSRLTRQILESSNENYTSLADEIELIENYISIQQLLYKNTFECNINVDESIDADSIFLPPMLTQPFIENAIKHGLGGKASEGKLDINFKLNGEKLLFEVSDNGAGFSDVKKPDGHKSMAMDITRKRLVNYTQNPGFTVDAGNLFDHAENIIGAKVAFEIPYIYEN